MTKSTASRLWLPVTVLLCSPGLNMVVTEFLQTPLNGFLSTRVGGWVFLWAGVSLWGGLLALVTTPIAALVVSKSPLDAAPRAIGWCLVGASAVGAFLSLSHLGFFYRG